MIMALLEEIFLLICDCQTEFVPEPWGLDFIEEISPLCPRTVLLEVVVFFTNDSIC